jgi:acyl-coenzyme A synthetase/AMP-(fatty) acid ligase
MHKHDFSYYARESPYRLALVEPDGRHWSRAELQQECDRLAAELRRPATTSRVRMAGRRPNSANAIALALAARESGDSVLTPFGISPEQENVHYCGLSLADPGARAWAIDSLHHGHAVILVDRWTPEGMLRDIDRYRVTTSYLAPEQYMQLLSLPPVVRSAYTTSSIRHIICPDGPCPQPLEQAMTPWWLLSHSCGPTTSHT